MNKKKILFILKSPPYASTSAQEGLETILAASVFEQDITVLFMGDGVLQLLKSQQGNTIQRKNIASLLEAFPVYDIEKVYFFNDHQHNDHLINQEYLLAAKEVSSEIVTQLLSRHDVVLTY